VSDGGEKSKEGGRRRVRRNKKDFQVAETMIKEGVIIEEYINEQIYSTQLEYIGFIFDGGEITRIFSLLKQWVRREE
jgi:hypothetical protein